VHDVRHAQTADTEDLAARRKAFADAAPEDIAFYLEDMSRELETLARLHDFQLPADLLRSAAHATRIEIRARPKAEA